MTPSNRVIALIKKKKKTTFDVDVLAHVESFSWGNDLIIKPKKAA